MSMFQISTFVAVLALAVQSALSAPGVPAPVAYAAPPAAVAAYAPAIPYNIPPFAAALNVQTRALAAPFVAAPAYAPAALAIPAAYAAPAGIAPAYSVSRLFWSTLAYSATMTPETNTELEHGKFLFKVKHISDTTNY
jgi:hypothetical protein